MNQLRFILADRFGFSWKSIDSIPGHIAQSYINDISRSKTNFKGVSSQSVRQFGNDLKDAGFSLDR